MLPTFPYTGMVITGVMHSILGLAIFICTIVGYYIEHQGHHRIIHEANNHLDAIFGGLIPISMWIIMVGILGVLAGKKRSEHRQTHNLKIAYMVTAILSAVIFSLAAMGLSFLIRAMTDFHVLGVIIDFCGFAVFVLSIVSSSICCCCAKSSPVPAGMVFIQAAPNHHGQSHLGQSFLASYPANIQSPQEGLANPGYQPNYIPSPEYKPQNAVV